MPTNPLNATFDVSYSDRENMYEYENEELMYKYVNKEKSPLVNKQNINIFKKWFFESMKRIIWSLLELGFW